MDSEQQQKDFLSHLFPVDLPMDHLQNPSAIANAQQSMAMPMFQFNGSPSPTSMSMQPGSISQNMGSQLNLDLLGSLMSMQGIEPHPQSGMPSGQAPYNPQLMLEQQFKLAQLQQLQQLQNQIFQQQIALISGQVNTASEQPSEARAPSQYHGLPTPGSSAELRATQPVEYVSPMILNFSDGPQDHNGFRNSDTLSPLPPHHHAHQHQHHHASYPARGSTSAPAHIAFSAAAPSDLDFDVSPLTSPWLGAANQQPTASTSSSARKRTASSSGDEKPSRKRQSPAIRPTAPAIARKIPSGSRSTNSTPLLRSTRSRRGSIAAGGVDVPGDTPSPVDLSMPPPAPPSSSGSPDSNNNINSSNNNSNSNFATSGESGNTNKGMQLTPVTPASIMNLGRLGINSGLTPASSRSARSAAAGKAKAPSAEGSSTKAKTKKSSGIAASPSLKAILPAGATPPLNIDTIPAPGTQLPRKTSHKAAEQKRRDSLKTTFDDLRVLLPPIPLPSDLDDPTSPNPFRPVLPGALPPRGPPKAGGEGPNKGVSKLQLLICGNGYIRTLKGRVERRDEEIGKLRKEVRRLRELAAGAGGEWVPEEDGGEMVDLDLDLDEGELGSFGGAGGGSMKGDEDGEYEDD